MANLRRSRTGRRLVAVRTNERAAASLGISVVGVKLFAFSVSAGIAAVAGILVAFSFPTIRYEGFNVFESINAVGNAVIGGLGFVLGAAVGALSAVGGLGTEALERWIDLGAWAPVVGSVLVIVILLANQNGAADSLVRRLGPLARRLRLGPRPRPVPALPEVELEEVVPAPLTVRDLTVRFGTVVAVDDVSFEVGPGEVVGLIGPNGAGKTTVIDAVTGFVKPATGSISLGDRPIEKLRPNRRAALGLRRSFQSLELFEDLDVEDNIRAGAEQGVSRRTWVTDLFWPGVHSLSSTAIAAIRGFALEDELHARPEELSFGRRRLVGIARSVASGPSVVLLDEPAAGLDEGESRELAGLIRRLAEERKMGGAARRARRPDGHVDLRPHHLRRLRAGHRLGSARCDPRRPRRSLPPTSGVERDDGPLLRGRRGRRRRRTVRRRGLRDGRGPGRARGGGTMTDPQGIRCVGLSAGYGGMAVVRDIDLHVAGGEVVALLGANGAGKTTTLLTMAGEMAPIAGEVQIDGVACRTAMHTRCRRGLSFLPEERSVFTNLSTKDNLRLAGVTPAVAIDLFPRAGAAHEAERRPPLRR